MRLTLWLPVVALVLAIALPAQAANNVTATFTNNTQSASAGLNWWLTPNSTVSGEGSDVLSHSVTNHYPGGAKGKATAVEIQYTGNRNVGQSAKVWCQTGGSGTAWFIAEWINSNGVVIGTSKRPCSFGGTHVVQAGQTMVAVPIDNPNPDYVMVVDSLRYSLSTVHFMDPSEFGTLDMGTLDWDAVPNADGVNIAPLDEVTFFIPVPDEETYPILEINVMDLGEPSTLATTYAQVPEPLTLGLLAAGGLAILRRRSR